MKKEHVRIHSLITKSAESPKAINTIYFTVASVITSRIGEGEYKFKVENPVDINFMEMAELFANRLSTYVVCDRARFKSILFSMIKAKYRTPTFGEITTPLSTIGWDHGEIDIEMDIKSLAVDAKITLFGA